MAGRRQRAASPGQPEDNVLSSRGWRRLALLFGSLGVVWLLIGTMDLARDRIMVASAYGTGGIAMLCLALVGRLQARFVDQGAGAVNVFRVPRLLRMGADRAPLVQLMVFSAIGMITALFAVVLGILMLR